MTTELYNIKTFEPSFTDKEIKLRRNIEQAIPEEVRHYVTEEDLENLKEYRKTSDSFFPENHFYAFKGDELVGFIHLWPQPVNSDSFEYADMSIPYVKEGEQDVETQLYNALLDKVNELGITELRIVVDPRETIVVDKAKQFGFSFDEVDSLNSQSKVDDFNLSISDTFEVKEFNREEHGQGVLDLYTSVGYSSERIENQFDWLENDIGDRVVSWKVAFEDDDLVGQSVAFVYENGDRGQVSAVTHRNDYDNPKELVETIFASHLKSLKARGIEEFDFTLLSRVLDQRELYESLGFEFTERNRYKLDV